MQYFKKITLQTPESIQLEFLLAGIGSRAFALLIDYTLLGLCLAAVASLWAWLSYLLVEYLDAANIEYSGLQNWLIAIPLLLVFVIFVGYFVFFETLWQGQTPGKRFAKIRVIQDNGKPVGLAQATLRALLRPLDDALWLGTFFIVFGKREKRLGDWIASTIVIQEDRPITAANFALSPEAQRVAEQLLEITDFSRLLPDDFAVVLEYLQRRSLMHPAAREQTAHRLHRQVQSLLMLEQLPYEMSSDLFLEAIYLAYQQSEIV
jgi:uncharacterized RDD family membrane protein YckC